MKQTQDYVGQGLPIGQIKAKMEQFEVQGPRCTKCRGTIVSDPTDARFSECFQCGTQYQYMESGEIVPRWGGAKIAIGSGMKEREPEELPVEELE